MLEIIATAEIVVIDVSTNNPHLGVMIDGTAHALCNRRYAVWQETDREAFAEVWNFAACPRCTKKASVTAAT